MWLLLSGGGHPLAALHKILILLSYRRDGEKGSNMKPAIYIHDTKSIPYAMYVALAYKTIETRTRDMLGRFVGENVLIIRTRSSHESDVIGTVTISEKHFYSASELEDLRNKTLIPPGSKYDCHGRGKWGYTLINPVMFSKPIPLSAYTVEHKTRSFALLSA